jgi:hypothetical protein
MTGLSDWSVSVVPLLSYSIDRDEIALSVQFRVHVSKSKYTSLLGKKLMGTYLSSYYQGCKIS